MHQQWGTQVLTTVTNDDSYVGYMSSGSKSGCMGNSPEFRACKVVVIPFVIRKSSGSGWVFQKNSPLLPIFNHYHISLMKEAALYKRMAVQYTNNPLAKCQICDDYDGDPIGPEKVFSLFGLMVAGACFSVITLL